MNRHIICSDKPKLTLPPPFSTSRRPQNPPTITLKTGKGSKKANAKTLATQQTTILSSSKDNTPTNVIYLGHIPLPLEETELTSFLTQFGPILALHLSRSKRTGNPKGFGFVKFMDGETAKIVSDTMNGYFLDNRRMVSHVVTKGALEKMGDKIFKGKFRLVDFKKGHATRVNKKKSATEIVKVSVTQKKGLKTKVNKLKGLGIDDYGFESVISGVAAVVEEDVAVPKREASSSKKSNKTKRKSSDVESEVVAEAIFETTTPKAKKSKTVDEKKSAKKTPKASTPKASTPKASTPKTSSKSSSNKSAKKVQKKTV